MWCEVLSVHNCVDGYGCPNSSTLILSGPVYLALYNNGATSATEVTTIF